MEFTGSVTVTVDFFHKKRTWLHLSGGRAMSHTPITSLVMM
jgi:hypothetical protein